MRASATIVLAAVCVLAAAPARAQTRFPVWVEGRWFQDRDKTRDHIVRTGPGGGIAAGIDLTPRFGLQVAADWPRTHVERIEWSSLGRLGGIRTVDTISHRAPALSVYTATHLLTTGRARVTVLAGLARVHTPTHSRAVREHLGPDGAVLNREEYERRDDYPKRGLAIGVDLPLRVTHGLSIVPSVHAVYFPLEDYGRDGFVRPSVGMRWTF